MIEESSFEDEISRSCLVLSSHMENCFRETYGRLGSRIVGPLDPDKFDNASNKAKEIGIRAILALGLVFSVVFAGAYIALSTAILTVGSKLFRATGIHLQKDNFTHIRGKGEEVALKDFTVMVWDAGDKKSYPDGLRPWKMRENDFIEAIRQEKPTVLVLQGVDDPVNAENLIKQLGDYAHFYTHLGVNTWGETSGCLIATQAAVDHFSHTNFEHTDATGNRGFSCLELKANPQDTKPSIRIIGTQVTSEEHIRQITANLKTKTVALPTLFVGNSSVDLSHLLHHTFEGATHSDALAEQYRPLTKEANPAKNLISLFKYNRNPAELLPVNENKLYCLPSKAVPGFDASYNTRTAVTDNHAILTPLQFKS